MKAALIFLSVTLLAFASAQQATGFLDTATPDSASGWACFPSQPWRTLYVQIHVDGRLVGSAAANRPREPAVGQQCGGNSNHGFIFNFPPEFQRLLADGSRHTVRAFIQPFFPQIQRIELNNSPRYVQIFFPTFTPIYFPTYILSADPIGFLDTATPQSASGWTCDPDDFNRPLRVDLYIDGQFVASTTANQQREAAVGQQCGGNTFHGFSYNWDFYSASLLNDGNIHTVAAYAIDYPSGSDAQLTGSPMTVIGTRVFPTFPPSDNQPKGFLDVVTNQYAAGWACDLDNPAQPIQVQIYANGQYIGQTTANQPRESAVGQQCGGYSNRGWRFNFPYFIPSGTVIRAYAINIPTGNNLELNNSPQTV